MGLVILTCGEHEDDAQFKKEVLGDQELVRVLKEKEVSVWAADSRSREGYQGMSRIRTVRDPFAVMTMKHRSGLMNSRRHSDRQHLSIPLLFLPSPRTRRRIPQTQHRLVPRRISIDIYIRLQHPPNPEQHCPSPFFRLSRSGPTGATSAGRSATPTGRGRSCVGSGAGQGPRADNGCSGIGSCS